jgi:predicted transcriptional regulator YdeE
MFPLILGLEIMHEKNNFGTKAGTDAESGKIEIDEMKIAGVSIRTTNQDGKSMKDQPEFWQKFFRESIKDKIPNKLHPEEVLGVYYNYESDYTGEYDFLIGFEVDSFDNIPEEFIKLTLPGGIYKVFNRTEKMSLGEKVFKLWQDVWSSNSNRSYRFDIEEYDITNLFSDNPDINIYIGIK